MAQITLTLSETKTKQFLADIVPDVITSNGGHELKLSLDEKQTATKRKAHHRVTDGKKSVTKKGNSIILKGKHTEIVLEPHDLKRIKQLTS